MDAEAESHQQQNTSLTGHPGDHNADDTLVNDDKKDGVSLEDWSLTGKGSHIDFDDKDKIPLEQGRFLGRGATGKEEKKEIDILKKISHNHVLQLIGTYTQHRVLGILLYPVATCDLYTFFEDVEAWSKVQELTKGSTTLDVGLDAVHKARLEALDYDFPVADKQSKAALIYNKIGCIISAAAYLHQQKIRHKDLKPSNILLSRGKLWLSDFGSATDFSLLSQSATDNERGTPRYFAPEVAAYELNGRAADIFSLGCVLLEILVLDDRGTLQHLRDNRSANPCYHANLEKIEIWLAHTQPLVCPQRYYLESEVRRMLLRDPDMRPVIETILRSATASEGIKADSSAPSIFEECCQQDLVTRKEHEMKMATLQQNHEHEQALFSQHVHSLEVNYRRRLSDATYKFDIESSEHNEAKSTILQLRTQLADMESIVRQLQQHLFNSETKRQVSMKSNAQFREDHLNAGELQEGVMEVNNDKTPLFSGNLKQQIHQGREKAATYSLSSESLPRSDQSVVDERQKGDSKRPVVTRGRSNQSSRHQKQERSRSTSEDTITRRVMEKLETQLGVNSTPTRSRYTSKASKENTTSQREVPQKIDKDNRRAGGADVVRGTRSSTFPWDDNYTPQSIRSSQLTTTSERLDELANVIERLTIPESNAYKEERKKHSLRQHVDKKPNASLESSYNDNSMTIIPESSACNHEGLFRKASSSTHRESVVPPPPNGYTSSLSPRFTERRSPSYRQEQNPVHRPRLEIRTAGSIPVRLVSNVEREVTPRNPLVTQKQSRPLRKPHFQPQPDTDSSDSSYEEVLQRPSSGSDLQRPSSGSTKRVMDFFKRKANGK